VTPGTRSLVADLATAGVVAEVRRDALAGDFDPWTGDPTALIGRAPGWIVDAALVRAYAIAPPSPPRSPPAPRPRRVLTMPPTERQLELLAAARRLIDAGQDVTPPRLARAVRRSMGILADQMSGLVDRDLLRVLSGPTALVVLGPRAHLYPERSIVRTQRSIHIETLIRAGQTIEEIVGSPTLTPPATRAEVYRVRATYCRDLPRTTPMTHPTGDSHHKVLELLRQDGALTLSEIARRVGISRARVGQIVDNAKRLGQLG
jgi:hypothetical protein